MDVNTFNAIGTWLAPSIGLGIVAIINWQAKRQADKNAISTLRAQAQASKAAERAASAAERLIAASRQTNNTLTAIKDTGEKTQVTAEKTHDLVNGNNTVLVKTIEVLTGRIAKENPDDVHAQIDARKAHDAFISKEAADAKVGNLKQE